MKVRMKVIMHVAGESQRLMLNQQIPAGISERGIIEDTLHKRRLIKICTWSLVGLSPTGNSINSNLKFLSLSQAETKSLKMRATNRYSDLFHVFFFTALKASHMNVKMFHDQKGIANLSMHRNTGRSWWFYHNACTKTAPRDK